MVEAYMRQMSHEIVPLSTQLGTDSAAWKGSPLNLPIENCFSDEVLEEDEQLGATDFDFTDLDEFIQESQDAELLELLDAASGAVEAHFSNDILDTQAIPAFLAENWEISIAPDVFYHGSRRLEQFSPVPTPELIPPLSQALMSSSTSSLASTPTSGPPARFVSSQAADRLLAHHKIQNEGRENESGPKRP